jgi:uncharacterized cupin superfamily protein
MSTDFPITNLDEPLTESGGNGGSFEFRGRWLAETLGLERLGCSVYVVPPGKRAYPYHAHGEVEEMFVILSGEGTLRHEGEQHAIRAGDVIASPLGTAHQIINSSDQNLRYLAISSISSTDVVRYPDSGKILAFSRCLGQSSQDSLRHISRASDAVDYYDGEV